MAWFKEATYPAILATIVGFVILFSFFYPGTFLDQVSSKLVNWATVMICVIVWVGVINVVRSAVREVKERVPGRWYVALIQLFLMAVMFISGFGEGKNSTAPGAPTVINWLFNNYFYYGALGSMALVGIWAVTAAYRAFRVRSAETFLFFIGAFFVLLRNAPIGGVIWTGFPIIGDWIMNTPFMAMQRGLTVGLGIAIVAYALRYYLGREKAAYGG